MENKNEKIPSALFTLIAVQDKKSESFHYNLILVIA